VTDALALHDVAIPFGNAPGLHGLRLAVAPGERLALLGPSGEGKTTLLRAIAGLTAVTDGRVLIDGHDVTTRPPEQRSAVYLHQQPVLFPHLTVHENVAFPLVVRGVGRADQQRTVQPLLERLHIAPLGNRLPRTLSGGQRHRVALARALAASPRVLLLDEPLSALDPALRDDVREAIRDAHTGSDAALLLVTHDLDDAALLGDRIAVLLDRTIAQIAAPDVLFARPAELAVMRFLGAHQELPGTVISRDLVETPLGRLATPVHAIARDTRVRVGVRDEALRCVALTSASDTLPTGRVEALHHRARGSTARVRIGDVQLHAMIDASDAPAIGDAVGLQLDPRALVLFAD
jgi:putative spermidine/putrescine transport system ATP-binding protein